MAAPKVTPIRENVHPARSEADTASARIAQADAILRLIESSASDAAVDGHRLDARDTCEALWAARELLKQAQGAVASVIA